MIIVAFQPRSASSSAMKWLQEAGASLYGEKFPKWISEDHKRFNSEGFFECDETCKGIDRDLGADVLIKILLRPLIQNSIVPQSAKIILCERNLEDLTQSQLKAAEITGAHDYEKTLAWNAYWYSEFDKWAIGRDVIRIKFDEILSDETKVKNRIVAFSKGRAI